MTRDNYEMNSNRLSRGGSLFGTDPQKQLRTALRANDFNRFQKLVSFGAADIEFVYGYPDHKNCLEIAICEADEKNSKIEFVKYLIERGCDVNKINEIHGAAPIHFAVENKNIEALKVLLECDRIDVNVKYKGDTALLLAIKQIEDLDDNDEQDLIIYEQMIELLLKAGSNVNAPDLKNVTPILSAAEQGLEKVITLILENAHDPVDIDSYKDISGNTARYYLKEAFPELEAKFNPESEASVTIDAEKLFSHLHSSDERSFVRDYKELIKKNEHRSVLNANNGMYTLLQLATEKGMENAVEILLKNDADANATFSGNSVRPVAIACRNGYNEILKKFIQNDSTLYEPVNGDSLVQILLKGTQFHTKDPKSNFSECLNTLLTVPKVKAFIDVNHLDFKHNTALHYAARNGDQNAVLELLRKGACVGLRNKFNEPPLADINAKTLETFLNECITDNMKRPSDDDYEIRLKYSFLVYPNISTDEEDEELIKPLLDDTNNNRKNCDSILSPETEALMYMTQNEELRPLLKHPIITSFLHLKWQRISCLFKTNITFYSLFWLSLIIYIIFGYVIEKEQIKSIQVISIITYIAATSGLIVLILRELFQLLLSPFSYIQSLQNWVEISVIIVTAWILFNDTLEGSTKQQLSAVAILLSSAELVLLIGHFPHLSTYIVMLRTVSWNFFKFILWYCILIIAFALSFYVLFKKLGVEDQTAPNPNNTEEDEEEHFFEDPASSLFKTIVMLTGEFDAGSIKFSTFPVTSHVIFIVFVFMIPIVLFNLLNGLAVSDTQEIRENAELVEYISRVELISYFEGIFIGNLYTKHATFWSYLPSYLQDLKFITPKMYFIKKLATRISLFPDFLPLYRIVVKPNQDNIIEVPRPVKRAEKIGDDFEDVESGTCCFDLCQSYRLDPKIVKNAKIVLNKKAQESELTEIKSQLSRILQILEGKPSR